MLRITEISDDGEEIVMKLEGKVIGVWVEDLKRVCLFHRDERSRVVVLDFSGVTFIEARGLEMLKHLEGDRVKTINCSPFINSLLSRFINKGDNKQNGH